MERTPGTVMDLDEYGQFPLRSFLGLEIEDLEPGRVVARVEITDDLLNPNGSVHGGVIFTMVDTAMGKAAMSVLDEGQLCTTIEIQIRFLRPAMSGHLEASIDVVKPGRKIIHLEARVVDGGGRLIATGAGTFAVLSGA
jgi:acyl-CoA thioesterase